MKQSADAGREYALIDVILGPAPMLIGIFFFGAIQAFFIGVLGKYVGSTHTQVLSMPLVVEIEQVN